MGRGKGDSVDVLAYVDGSAALAKKERAARHVDTPGEGASREGKGGQVAHGTQRRAGHKCRG